MKDIVIKLTQEEADLLAAYGLGIGKDPADIIADNGKAQAFQNALRAFATSASASGSLDSAIATEVLKDSGAVFNAVWGDWQGKKLFAPLVATHLQVLGSAASDAPRLQGPVSIPGASK